MIDQMPAAGHAQVSTELRKFKSRLPEPVKAGLRGTSRGVGLLSSPLRQDPDFLIIGTKRGGTTSLWYALAGHPDVLPLFPGLQELKSAHYFDLHYERPRSWYRSFFATTRTRKLHEQRTGHRAVTGEASPYYMFHPLAARRIKADLPDVKLIVSLRDPVERLWSHYRERLASGTEVLDLSAALAAEPGRLAGEEERIVSGAPHYYSFHHDLSSYLARGRYLEHLRGYLELFGPDQLLVLRAEDYYENPLGELDKVSSLLGIRPFTESDERVEPQHYNKLPRATLEAGLRAQLREYYQPHVAALETALGRCMDWPNFR